MSSIDSAIAARLEASTAIAALVGTRIYFDELPPPPAVVTLPAIRLSKVSDLPNPTVPGARTARVQASCYANAPRVGGARSPGAVEALASAVEDLFHVPRLNASPAIWSTKGGTQYRIMISRTQSGPRYTEEGSGYQHIPIDILVDFREVD